MANLYFQYSSMNAGKTLDLIKTYYNFVKTDENNNVISDNVVCLTSAKDDRFGNGIISSRPLQNTLEAFAIDSSMNLFDFITSEVSPKRRDKIDLILIDEVQFFTKEQIHQLALIVDKTGIDVICYGLRTNFKGELFEGSATLLGIADKIREIKNRCFCGKKATMNLLFDENNIPLKNGGEVQIGSESKYISLCRKHFNQSHELGQVIKK